MYVTHDNTYHPTLRSNCIRQVNEKLANSLAVTRQDSQEIHHHNQIVKTAAYRAIKRPGRSNDLLNSCSSHLSNPNGLFHRFQRIVY